MTKTGVFSALLAIAVAGLLGSQALAETKGAPKGQPPATTPEPAPADDPPSFAALEVPGLLFGSNPNLEVEAFEVVLSVDKATYTYRVRNRGNADVRVAAAFSLPEFGANPEEGMTYQVGPDDNPINLTLSADGAPVNAKVEMRALVLGVDRVADIKAANLPLIPFAPETERAVQGLAADAQERLINLGIIAPPSSADGEPPLPDWTLSIDHVWEQNFPAGKTTELVMSFKPITGTYEVDRESAGDLDSVQEEVCLSDAALRSFKQKLRGNLASQITDISLSNNGPMRWGTKPATTISVERPSADTIVAFCGSARSVTGQRVTDKITDEEANSVRILLIGPPK